jgi:hypothetical protein
MSTSCSKFTTTFDFNFGMGTGSRLVDRLGNWNGTVYYTTSPAVAGTPNNAPDYYSGGPYNQAALRFNGSTYVDLGPCFFGMPISLSFWALWTAPPDSSLAWQRFFDFGSASLTTNFLMSPYGFGSPGAPVIGAAVGNGNTNENINTNTLAVPGVWTHYTVTVSSAGLFKLYVNGTSRFNYTMTGGGVPNGTRTNMYLGKSWWPDNPLFRGSISSFSIATFQELTADDASNLYNNVGCPPPSPPPSGTPSGRRLAQAASTTGGTCLALVLQNGTSSLPVTPAAISHNGGVNVSFALPAGRYAVLASLLNAAGAQVSVTATLPFSLVAPPVTRPPKAPLVANASSITLTGVVAFDLGWYTDGSSTLAQYAFEDALDASLPDSVSQAGGVALSNLSLSLNLALTAPSASGRRRLLLNGGVQAASGLFGNLSSVIVQQAALGASVSVTFSAASSLLTVVLATLSDNSLTGVSFAARTLTDASLAWLATADFPAVPNRPAVLTATLNTGAGLLGVTLEAALTCTAGMLTALSGGYVSSLVDGVTLLSLDSLCFVPSLNVAPRCSGNAAAFMAALPQAFASASNTNSSSAGGSNATAAAIDFQTVGNIASALNNAGPDGNTLFGGNNSAAAAMLGEVRNSLLAAVTSQVITAPSSPSSSNATSPPSSSGASAVNATAVLYAVAALVNASSPSAVAPISPSLVAPALQALAAVSTASVSASSSGIGAGSGGGGGGALATTLQQLVNATSTLVFTGNATGSLTAGDLNASVAILSTVANAAASAVAAPTNGVADTLVASLSLVVTASSSLAAAAASSPPSSGSAASSPPSATAAAASTAAVYAGVAAAVSSLTNALVSHTLATCASSHANVSAAGRSVSSTSISIAVSCADPNAAGDPLFSAGLVLAGSAAALEPLPASVFAGTSVDGGGSASTSLLGTSFAALGFDPHGPGGSDVTVVRLQFTNGSTGAVIPLAGLTEPIALQLPVSPPSSANASLAAMYWDASHGSYQPGGVLAGPNPVPANATWSWRSGFQVDATGSNLAMAWTLNMSGCFEQFLNCSDDWARTLPLSLDPEAGVGSDTLTCGPSDTGMLLSLIHISEPTRLM